MANVNIVILMGNLTRDPEIRYTPSGVAVAQAGLAINRRFKDSKTNELRDEVTFLDVEFWGRNAETAGQYLGKGSPVFIQGRLRLDQWEDKQTGQKRSKLKVVAESFQFVGPRSGGKGGEEGGEGSGRRSAPPQAAQPPQGAAGHSPDQAGNLDIPAEEIPF
jgi:single-strand DNA-binding protein